MTALRPGLALLAAVTLLFVGCDGYLINNAPAPEFDSDLFLSVIESFTEDDVLNVARGEAVLASNGTTVSLGDEYVARTWRPGFVEAWVMVTAFGDGPDPDCKGTGLGFVRCVQRHVDAGEVWGAGETCTVYKDGMEYHAHCEESLSGG